MILFSPVCFLLPSRWWPAEVSHPRDIPDNILRMRHDLGEFPVHFFGSNDYLWTYQARVFPYMEADANGKEKMGKGVDSTYKKGRLPTKSLQKNSSNQLAVNCIADLAKYLSIKLFGD